MRWPRLSILLALSAGLAVGGCGDDDGGAAPATTTTTIPAEACGLAVSGDLSLVPSGMLSLPARSWVLVVTFESIEQQQAFLSGIYDASVVDDRMRRATMGVSLVGQPDGLQVVAEFGPTAPISAVCDLVGAVQPSLAGVRSMVIVAAAAASIPVPIGATTTSTPSFLG